MAQHNIYSIQLLNDLHNHFPEILYNSQRFHTIQDLLSYIITVANISPFRRGSEEYNRTSGPVRNAAPTQLNTHVYPPAGPQVAPPLRQSVRAAPGSGGAMPPPQPSAAVYMTTFTDDGQQAAPLPNAINPLLNTLLGGLFGDILGGGAGGLNLNAFLDTRVPVYPTADQINNATTTYRASRRQDDICAICQDEIETNQDVRCLDHCNHYFHRNCIDTWFQGNVHCPTCRHDIRNTNATDSQENHINNQSAGATTPSATPNQQTPNAPPPVPENYRRLNIRRQV